MISTKFLAVVRLQTGVVFTKLFEVRGMAPTGSRQYSTAMFQMSKWIAETTATYGPTSEAFITRVINHIYV